MVLKRVEFGMDTCRVEQYGGGKHEERKEHEEGVQDQVDG